ncbi:hypothetical protein C7S15_2093 [Burkholderia cepacia]|nr:hypothetical protein [Burkholderia cepacia]
MSDVHESVDAVMRVATAPMRSRAAPLAKRRNKPFDSSARARRIVPTRHDTRLSESACTRSGNSL